MQAAVSQGSLNDPTSPRQTMSKAQKKKAEEERKRKEEEENERLRLE